MDFEGIPTRYHKKKLEHRLRGEKRIEKFAKQAKVVRPVSSGFLEKDDGEIVTQKDILKASNIGVASKNFDLKLDCGPYNIDYSSNGRYLALCGRRGHLGLIDWMTKTPLFETNVQEQCYNVKILHQETMIAVAQEKYTFMYDNQGVEIHCIKQLNHIKSMEFLPYHFLLATAVSYISYLDITMGEIISNISTFTGPIHKTCINPSNAVFCTGHKSGTVCMWTPTEKKFVVKLLCHHSPIESIAIDRTGTYLATTSLDKKLKIWDLRNNYEPLSSIHMPLVGTSMDYSQTGLLGVASGFVVQILKDSHLGCVSLDPEKNIVNVNQDLNLKTLGHAYLSHHSPFVVNDISFCPFEDVLGLGTQSGFSSIICPGAGEANFDALEENPFASKRYRQEREVKRLLNKIPAELIAIDSKVDKVHKEDILDEWERKRSALLGELPKPKPVRVKKNKKKGRSKATKIEMRKQNIRLERRMLDISEMMKLRASEGVEKLLNKIDPEEEAAKLPEWKRPTDILVSKKMGTDHKKSGLNKKRLKNALDYLIPNRRDPL